MENRVWHGSYALGAAFLFACEDIAMPEILSHTAKKYPDGTAMVSFGKSIPYAGLDRLAGCFAVAIGGLGVRGVTASRF